MHEKKKLSPKNNSIDNVVYFFFYYSMTKVALSFQLTKKIRFFRFLLFISKRSFWSNSIVLSVFLLSIISTVLRWVYFISNFCRNSINLIFPQIFLFQHASAHPTVNHSVFRIDKLCDLLLQYFGNCLRWVNLCKEIETIIDNNENWFNKTKSLKSRSIFSIRSPISMTLNDIYLWETQKSTPWP